MQKGIRVLLIVSLIINIVLGVIIVTNKREYSPEEYINKIDSLELELSSISNKRDSIKEVIDTVYSYLNETEKDYEEIRDVIINNTVNDDYLFFTEYLRQNKLRLDSLNCE